MNEARIRKARTCKACKEVMFVTAPELKEHGGMCQRASDIGLILPGVIIPQDGQIIEV